MLFKILVLCGCLGDVARALTASSNGELVTTFADGAKKLIRTAATGSEAQSSQLSSNVLKVEVTSDTKNITEIFSFDAEDKLFGVWEYPWDGKIDNSGADAQFLDIGLPGETPNIKWSNSRAPFFFSKSGFGIYAPTEALGWFNFTTTTDGQHQALMNFNLTSLSYYVIYNANVTDLLVNYMELSSKIRMPADAGYGPNFWSDNFEQDFHGSVSNAQENYFDVVDHLYYGQVRATAMFADHPFGTGDSGWGNFDFDPVFYPSPNDMISNLSTWGFEFQVWVANKAQINTQLWNESIPRGWVLPDISGNMNASGSALNLTIPEAYDYFLEKLSYFPSIGVKGYKIDRGEEGELPIEQENVQHPIFEKLCYESMAQVWGEGQFYNFARSVFDTSRSWTQTWNGDAYGYFPGLQYSVASGIRAGLLGFAQWGSDTGGYERDAADPDEEVFGRWMHFSAFCPMYEIEIGNGHSPWYDYSEELMAVLKKTADIHTRLIPFIRSHVYQATQTGLPVMRALFLEFPEDPKSWDIADEYMFGKDILVAPIVAAGGSRSVYFPGDGKYLEFWNKTDIFLGGQTLDIANMSRLDSPAYIREGALIPTGDLFQGNAKWISEWTAYVQLEFYPSPSVPVTTFTYYRGNEADSHLVNSTMVITASYVEKCNAVVVEYGDFGIDASLQVFAKGGMKNVSLPAASGGSGKVVVREVVSLFD